MEERDRFLKEFRGEAIGEINPDSSINEHFQNQVLRPILKLQNDLFLASFKNYISKNKKEYYNLSLEKKMSTVDNAIHKDVKYRNTLKGMIVGLFTIEDYAVYIQNSTELNKRMLNMLIERLKSQIQLFEKN